MALTRHTKTTGHGKKSTIADRAGRYSDCTCRLCSVYELVSLSTVSSKIVPTILILCAALMLTQAGQLVANDFANDEPFLARVANVDVCLRSGPGDDYYATNLIEAGQMLEVYYVIDDHGCAVRPPAGSYTWVDARNIQLGNNHVGEVLINGVKARVGSELGNMCGTTQVMLDRGERVFVFERVETPNDIDTPVWYKIAPPAGEFRFIRMSDLQFERASMAESLDMTEQTVDYESDQPKPLQMQSPIIQVSDMQPQRNATQSQAPSRPSTRPAVSSQVVPPGSLAVPSSLSQNNQTPQQPTGPGIDSDDFREILEQLKLDLSEAVIEQETAVDTMQSLSHQARMLYQAASDTNDRAEVYRLIAGIERVTRVRQADAETAVVSRETPDRNDGRVMQLTRANDTATNANASTNGTNNAASSPKRPSTTAKKSQPADQLGQLPIPRTDTMYTTPEPDYADHIAQYSAQESFFDHNGQYYRGGSGTHGLHTQYFSEGQYQGNQELEFYIDENGRYVDASGQMVDEQTLNAILQNADSVLMLDPNSGEYYEMPRQNGTGGHYAGMSNGSAPPKKSWVQRFISGEMFQKNDMPANPQQYARSFDGQQVPTGSGYAPYTHQLAYGNHATTQQTPKSKGGFFASSQPSILPQQQDNNNRVSQNMTRTGNAYRNMIPGNVANSHGMPQAWPQGMPPVMQEIPLPEGVEIQGEVVVYDESQGVNLLSNMQNPSQTDQIALLIQHMGTPTASGVTLPAASPIVQGNIASPGNSQPRLPLTEAESRMLGRSPTNIASPQNTPARPVQLMAMQQNTNAPNGSASQATLAGGSPHKTANHQVTGRLENGVGQVSADAFDAIGKLGRVKNASDEMPKYALADENGKPICLLSPAVGIELNSHIDQTVGITGVKGSYSRDGKTIPHIAVGAVYPIAR